MQCQSNLHAQATSGDLQSQGNPIAHRVSEDSVGCLKDSAALHEPCNQASNPTFIPFNLATADFSGRSTQAEYLHMHPNTVHDVSTSSTKPDTSISSLPLLPHPFPSSSTITQSPELSARHVRLQSSPALSGPLFASVLSPTNELVQFGSPFDPRISATAPISSWDGAYEPLLSATTSTAAYDFSVRFQGDSAGGQLGSNTLGLRRTTISGASSSSAACDVNGNERQPQMYFKTQIGSSPGHLASHRSMPPTGRVSTANLRLTVEELVDLKKDITKAALGADLPLDGVHLKFAFLVNSVFSSTHGIRRVALKDSMNGIFIKCYGCFSEEDILVYLHYTQAINVQNWMKAVSGHFYPQNVSFM